MFDREREEQHLAMADKHIEEAEIRIQKLMDRLDILREKKLNTKQTEQLLSLLVQVLVTMQRHRNIIIKRLKDGV
jgi:nitrogen-specific signal transduction histidine kinase